MAHQSPDLPPPKPEAVARALEFCRKRGSFIFREVQNEFNFGRDELIMVMDALRRRGFIEKFGPVRDGQPEWRMRPAVQAGGRAPRLYARPPVSLRQHAGGRGRGRARLRAQAAG